MELNHGWMGKMSYLILNAKGYALKSNDFQYEDNKKVKIIEIFGIWKTILYELKP